MARARERATAVLHVEHVLPERKRSVEAFDGVLLLLLLLLVRLLLLLLPLLEGAGTLIKLG